MAANALGTIIYGSHSSISLFLYLSSVDIMSSRLIPLHQPLSHTHVNHQPTVKALLLLQITGKDHFRLHCSIDVQPHYLLQCWMTVLTCFFCFVAKGTDAYPSWDKVVQAWFMKFSFYLPETDNSSIFCLQMNSKLKAIVGRGRKGNCGQLISLKMWCEFYCGPGVCSHTYKQQVAHIVKWCAGASTSTIDIYNGLLSYFTLHQIFKSHPSYIYILHFQYCHWTGHTSTENTACLMCLTSQLLRMWESVYVWSSWACCDSITQ